MIVTFTRMSDQRDTISALMPDRPLTDWTAPTYGGSLPHDFVHLVVEGAFALVRGFWGRVEAGWDPAAVNLAAPRAREEGRAAWGEDREELLVAEALASTDWFDTAVGDGPRLHAIALSCSEFGVEMPARFNLNQVAGATLAMRFARDLFSVERHFAVNFSMVQPRESFAQLLHLLEARHATRPRPTERR